MADFNTNLAKLAADAFGERTEDMSYQQVHNLIEDTITEDPAVQRALDDSTAGTRALMHHILDMNAEDVSARMAATRPHTVPLPPGVPPFDYGEIRQMRDQMLRTSSAIVTGTQQLMIALAQQPDPYDATAACTFLDLLNRRDDAIRFNDSYAYHHADEAANLLRSIHPQLPADELHPLPEPDHHAPAHDADDLPF